MARWTPDTRERLTAVAVALFVERGFEQTTAADIASEAGLTERTFFRHFADKREVLFDGQEQLGHLFVDAVEAAPEDVSPIGAVALALDAAATFFPERRRAHSRTRQTIVAANAALQERELLKMARLSESIAAALRARGVDSLRAELAAEAGIAVFGVAFRRWISDGEVRTFTEIQCDVLVELKALANE